MQAWIQEAAKAKDPQKVSILVTAVQSDALACPTQRINVVLTTRALSVEVNGVEVANTTRPRVLFESDLPYASTSRKATFGKSFSSPRSTPRVARTLKGIANYYTVELPGGEKIDNMMWCYEAPISDEATGIKGLVSFYDTKADLYLDAVLQKRPAQR